MLRINTCVEDLCKREGVMFIDIWDHYNKYRNLYSRGGFHLNILEKERLVRVLDEGVKKELQENKTQMQNREIVRPGLAGPKPVTIGVTNEVRSRCRD